jgi:hypothetical protein
MRTYRLTLFVRSDQLSTLLDLLENADGVQIGGDITDAADIAPLPPTPPPRLSLPVRDVVAALQSEAPKTTASTSRYANGKRAKGITGEDLVREVLRSGPANLDEIRRAFVHRGFAVTSAGVCVSKMLREDRIRHGMHGRFHLNTEGAGDGLRNGLPITH